MPDTMIRKCCYCGKRIGCIITLGEITLKKSCSKCSTLSFCPETNDLTHGACQTCYEEQLNLIRGGSL